MNTTTNRTTGTRTGTSARSATTPRHPGPRWAETSASLARSYVFRASSSARA